MFNNLVLPLYNCLLGVYKNIPHCTVVLPWCVMMIMMILFWRKSCDLTISLYHPSCNLLSFSIKKMEEEKERRRVVVDWTNKVHKRVHHLARQMSAPFALWDPAEHSCVIKDGLVPMARGKGRSERRRAHCQIQRLGDQISVTGC